MHAMKAHREGRGTAPAILKLGTRWGVSGDGRFNPRVKCSSYLLEDGWAPQPVWAFWNSFLAKNRNVILRTFGSSLARLSTLTVAHSTQSKYGAISRQKIGKCVEPTLKMEAPCSHGTSLRQNNNTDQMMII